MPADREKIVAIMFLEIESIAERCEGYRDELKSTIAEIIAAERGHMLARTNIDQKVADKINVVGGTLAAERSSGNA